MEENFQGTCVCGPEEGGDVWKDKGGRCSCSLTTREQTLVEPAAGMEVITEHLAGILSLSQEQDGKEAKRQALLLVSMAKTQAGRLVEDYLSHQGPPFSDNGAALPQVKIDGIPTLANNDLPSSPWKRLDDGLQAFSSLSEWLALVHLWQNDLNHKAWELLRLLEIAENNSRAISSNLATLLGRGDISAPSITSPSTTMKKKVAGYLVCKSYYEWLSLTERDLLILVVESSV
ncbi:cardiotrophin-2-like isoform X2 [Hyla sarda]|uniref:cardiotrophin-2-like isoform X2 n=1 Tax=Hyla sarda TaxID=327740 RepID=UPI0024C27037|nr:cardiotrophin-2-like isoform X2 [Hyla sarda]